MRTASWAVCCLLLGSEAAALAQEAPMPPLRPDQVSFRALYQELVETNTTLSSGSCTLAAERMAAHLKSAGFKDEDVTLFSTPEHPKEGGLVAVLHGRSKSAKPMLLSVIWMWWRPSARTGRGSIQAHRRERYFFAPRHERHEGDGCDLGRYAHALQAERISAKRSIKLALTCGEETTYAFNGAEWLSKNRPAVAAAFALNEGGGGRTDGHGKIWFSRSMWARRRRRTIRLRPPTRRSQLHPDPRQCHL